MNRQPIHITAEDAAVRMYETAAQRNPDKTPAQIRDTIKPLMTKFIRAGLFIIVETRDEAQRLNMRTDVERAWAAA